MLLTVSGCSESLFGAHGHGDGGPGGGDDANGPDSCAASCIADATADFDGTVDGVNDHWRYLGDERNRMWAPMLPVAGAMLGEANNRIERCTTAPATAACEGQPDALLVTSSGSSSTSDPALEYTSPGARVVQLVLRASVPGDSVEHRVRLYRNSREDVLFTALAAPGTTVAQAITVDALPGDRFLIALEPSGGRGGTAALRFFVIGVNTAFPSTCQLALTFSDASVVGPSVDDLCGGAFTSIVNTQPAAPALGDGPFPYQGMGVYLEPGFYLAGFPSLATGAKTIQFWVQNGAPSASKAWVFSDIDETTAGSIGIHFTSTPSLKLGASVVTATNPVTYTSQSIDFANPQDWHFVRVVRTADRVRFCLDGAPVMSFPFSGPTAPGRPPTLGRNGPEDVVEQYTGALDDVRAFSDALPCDE